MKALAFVAIVILLGAVSLGLSLSNSDLLNPYTGTAEARRIAVETDALAAQYEFDQQLQQVELNRIQEETNINVEALRARRAKELEVFEQEARRRSDLYEFAVLFGLALVAVATLVPSVALAYYLVRRGNAVRAGQIVASEKPGRRLLQFPSPDKRKRKQAPMASYSWPDEAA
jgi:hypothetical protein